MPTSSWDEIRTAYHVAQQGTVSGAAEVLGVHHATVIRHIDALEARVGVKLFQRHARGYTPTEAGEDLLKVGKATDDQMNQLVSRIRGQGSEISGELVVTTVAGLTGLFLPVIGAFQAAHPQLAVRYLSDTRLFRLEYGEAHVAIRAGNAPQEPDNVVQALATLSTDMVASRSYVERHGLPKDGNFEGHRFIGHAGEGQVPPYFRWMRSVISDQQVVFRAGDQDVLEQAVRLGLGIGPLPSWNREGRDDLIEVMPSMSEWDSRFWLVTHVDLHRTAKVQAFVSYLKSAMRDLPAPISARGE